MKKLQKQKLKKETATSFIENQKCGELRIRQQSRQAKGYSFSYTQLSVT